MEQMTPLNGGNPVSKLVSDEMLITDVSTLKIGDIIYSEWYGSNEDNKGDVRDPNRYHLCVITRYHRSEDGFEWLHFNGNAFNGEDWFKKLRWKFYALPSGYGAFPLGRDFQAPFRRYWKVGEKALDDLQHLIDRARNHCNPLANPVEPRFKVQGLARVESK